MYHIAVILVLLILGFVGYRTINPKHSKIDTPLTNPNSLSIVLPDKEPVTRRAVARWLAPSSSKIMGRSGPPLKCCGDYYADNIYIKPSEAPIFY